MKNYRTDTGAMKAPNGRHLVFADGVPKFPPKIAFMLATEAMRTRPDATSVYDPFCGNGTNLVLAGLNFPRISGYFGSDINQGAVYSTQINLATQLGISTQAVERDVVQLDASRDFLPRETSGLVIITDPPFGRRCTFAEGQSLQAAFANFRSRGVSDVFFCYDDATTLPVELKQDYKLREFLHRWDRKFYHASAK
jgi:tRNA G10  N-methylase Trm11